MDFRPQQARLAGGFDKTDSFRQRADDAFRQRKDQGQEAGAKC